MNSLAFAYFTERVKSKPEADDQQSIVKRRLKTWTTRRMILTTMILLLVLCAGIAMCLIVYFTEAKTCTTGNTVAFTVSVEKHQVIVKANETLHFEEVGVNTGNGFYQPTGIFTVPVKGIYMFDLSLAAKPRQKMDFWIVRNGRRLKRVFLSGSGFNWITTSSAVTVRLKEGDKVWVKSNKYVGQLIGNGLTSFSGFLINPPCQTNF